MSEVTKDVERAALAWLVRVNDPEFSAWEDWEAWLARDPRHGATYWRLAARDAELAAQLPERAAGPATPARAGGPVRARRLWLAAAAATAVVVVAGGLGLWGAGDQVVSTGPGERRAVALADGTVLHLDGSTRLELHRRDGRRARLVEGRVLAEVVHDARRPFVLAIGDDVVTDLGTVFDVTRLEGGLRVAVAEGLVQVEVDEHFATLGAGESLTARGGRVSRQAVSTADVDGWRRGRLAYRDAALAVVAADLSRALGRKVEVAPGIADRRFTGSLAVADDDGDLRARLELLFGVRIEESRGAWRLTPRQP